MLGFPYTTPHNTCMENENVFVYIDEEVSYIHVVNRARANSSVGF